VLNLIRVQRSKKEANDRIIQRFSNKVKASRMVQVVKTKRYHAKKKTKRQVRQAAIMREYYRGIREKMKYYS